MNVGYVVAAGLSLLVPVLLCRPWLTVSGPAGRLTTTGFGHVTGLTAAMANSVEANSYVYVPTSAALTVSGVCAGLAAFAVCVTLLATAAYLRTRRDVFSFVATGSSVTLVGLVMGQLWNVNGATSQMRSLVAPSQNSAGVGSVLRAMLDKGYGRHGVDAGAQSASHASLSIVAIVAVMVAFASALCAIAARLHQPVPVRVMQASRQAPTGRPTTSTSRADSVADPVSGRRDRGPVRAPA